MDILGVFVVIHAVYYLLPDYPPTIFSSLVCLCAPLRNPSGAALLFQAHASRTKRYIALELHQTSILMRNKTIVHLLSLFSFFIPRMMKIWKLRFL